MKLLTILSGMLLLVISYVIVFSLAKAASHAEEISEKAILKNRARERD